MLFFMKQTWQEQCSLKYVTDIALGQTLSPTYQNIHYKFITDVIMSAECIMEYVIIQ